MSTPSPCTGACALDAAGTRCTSCKRTIGEIEAWASMTEAERARVMRALAAR